MKKNILTILQIVSIVSFYIFGSQNILSQSDCEYFIDAAGPDRVITIDSELQSINNINLDSLLNANSNNTLGKSKSFESSWRFRGGAMGPRGPRVLFITVDEDVDFPNTGSGPPETYEFVYTVTDGTCQDSAFITVILQELNTPSLDEAILYKCTEEETIDNFNELFNAFSLKQIRELEGFWEDNVSQIFIENFPLPEGNYTYFDNTGNELKAEVIELDCSNEGIELSFSNPQITKYGEFDYYEVDVMIASTITNNSFKLGDGKLFLQYNHAAFGEFVSAYKNIEITTPSGYILGQTVNSNSTDTIYKDLLILDNTNDVTLPNSVPQDIFRFSLSFKQNYSSSVFSDNVDNTPRKLCRLKIKYLDANEDPGLIFESEGIYDNKFTTATICGLTDGGGEITDCLPELKTIIVNDTFVSNGATLSDSNFELLENISLYPNPTKNILFVEGGISEVQTIEVYSVSSRKVMHIDEGLDQINLSQLANGIYFLKLIKENAIETFKIIKN